MTGFNGTPQWLSNDSSATLPSVEPQPELKLPKMEPLTKEDVLSLLEADQDLWPQPLTEERILTWWSLASDWSWKYVTIEAATGTTSTAGIFFCIPLSIGGFKKLQKGKLKEHQIEEQHIWKRPVNDEDKSSCDRNVGLHVFHIEKDQSKKGWKREWGRMMVRAFDDLQEVVGRHNVEVLGYSALAVTPDGFRAFKDAGFELLNIEVSRVHTPIGGVEQMQTGSLTDADSKAATFMPSNGYWFFKRGQGNPVL